MPLEPAPLLQNRLEVHDRKQFEIKLEYQPSGADDETRYVVEMFLFLPASLNIDAETYPRADFYADIHNYVRFTTPVMALEEVLRSESSPLVRLEAWLRTGLGTEAELVYQAKLLCCIFRGALRRFTKLVDARCEPTGATATKLGDDEWAELKRQVVCSQEAVAKVLERFRAWTREANTLRLQEKTRASMRLVDEYMSLTVEQYFRKAVAEMDSLPRSGIYIEPRKELMAAVIREETYRKENQLRSVLSPTGDNEEYMHRIGFLKKFCMNILFLSARRKQSRHWEEVLFAIAAGLAMAFATAVAFWAQARFTQVSLNFFLIVVVGYMVKDRIKEGLRRIFSRFASMHLHDRMAEIVDPVTKRCLGTLAERVDYGRAVKVPDEIAALRCLDDFITVSQGELSETVIRYQKKIVLDAELLPRTGRGLSGVTDIIRFNVERFLRDMDDPELALEYVDLEDFSVGRVKGAKSYQVDVAFRFTTDEADQEKVSVQLVRLVLDRNGIKRMLRFGSEPKLPPRPEPYRTAA